MHNNDIQNGEAKSPMEWGEDALTLAQFTSFVKEIENQPAWRTKADREMDYYDGNQLDSEILQRQRSIGMPPAVEPIIGPAIDAVLGFEAKTRTDWRVIPDSDRGGDDVAEALNYKLNQAERHSKADRSCSDAYKSQVSVGLGWVEVSKESNPFRYPYRCRSVHRNEIWWDWLSVEPDLSDARYLIRRRWVDRDQAKLMFPDKAELIRASSTGWQGIDISMTLDGGGSTDLAQSYDDERGWSIEEMNWRDLENRRVCLFEVWYRVWKRVMVMKLPDGRIVEVDDANQAHLVALASGVIRPEWAVVPKMRRSMWMGPHCLDDGPTPYRHQKFPYVAFWGKREDRTGVPFGLIRGMIYQQDNINSVISKIRWGLSSVRTTRTAGAVVADDEAFRQQVARIDADIVLDADHMARQGAVFKVERDFQLNDQQFSLLADSRLAIQRSSGITSGFMGQQGNASSGVQEATQVEQSVQALADINDNFAFARAEVGDLLLSMIIEDSLGKQETVFIDGQGLREDREITLNAPTVDEETGLTYLTNDIERTKIKVTLNEVPSTPTFRTQQLAAMSEAFKSMPPQYQSVALPYLLNLMDVPDKDAIIKAIKDLAEQPTAEQIEARIKQAITDAGLDLKREELDRRYPRGAGEAQINLVRAQAMEIGIKAAFSAIQTAGAIVQTPQISPVADELMKSAGYQPPNPTGVDPNFPVPATMPAPTGVPVVQTNTSPQMPPVPQQPASPMQGIETTRNDSEPIPEGQA